jgi:uncharacterized phage protein gp47/JayE
MAIRKLYTINEIVNRMINKMSTTTSVSDYTPGSNIRTIFEAVSIFIEYLQFLVEQAYRSFYIDTASAGDLDERVQDFGMVRKGTNFSTGIIKMMRETPATSTFIISRESQFSTQPDVFGNTIGFQLDTDVTFVSGALEATGAISCLVSGVEGNVSSGTITNITSSIPGIDSVINPFALVDGATAETDEQLRKRVPIFLNGLKRANEDAIKSAIYLVEGITLVKTVENNPLPGYITVYVSTESGLLSDFQIESVTKSAEDTAAFGIKVVVVTPTVEYVTIELDAELDDENYDIEILKSDMRSAIDEVVRINPETELQMYNIILAADIQGVSNVKNVKVNGVQADYTVSGFKVIRLLDKDLDITINKV